jgi:hypothetical protein
LPSLASAQTPACAKLQLRNLLNTLLVPDAPTLHQKLQSDLLSTTGLLALQQTARNPTKAPATTY